MSTPDSAEPSRATTGIILMVVAMLMIPLVDGQAKYLSAGYSPLFISWARYLVACLIVLPFAAARYGGSKMFPAEQLAAHTLRTVFLVVSMTLYFVAVAQIPLATATSAYFIGPIVAVVLAVVILKESLTGRKLISLTLGFVGALVILQPGGAFEPSLLLAFGSGLFFALYMIATRRASKDSDPVKTLAFQCAIGAVLLTPQAIATWDVPAAEDLIFFIGIGVFSVLGHGLSIIAFRFTDASTLAPLVYIELIGAALIGYLVFDEIPGLPTAIGAALIVAAGLILLQRRNSTAMVE
jgi:drug/metabolite transporter (DMT)-like permease